MGLMSGRSSLLKMNTLIIDSGCKSLSATNYYQDLLYPGWIDS